MGIIAAYFLSLFKQLIAPDEWGRAYAIPMGTDIENVSTSIDGTGLDLLGTSERLVADGNRLYDSLIPDNDNFSDGTTDPNDNDCNDWERRLGLVQHGITNPPTTPTRLQRMTAIAQKMAYPGTNAPRQSAAYLQSALQAAGFPVYVFENPNNLTAAEILGIPAGDAVYDEAEYDEVEYDEGWSDADITIIANSVDPLVDAEFDIPAGNNHGTFFLGDVTLGAFASIPAIQETQFRQLVLNLKPAHMVGITFINFT